jgi:hypothetical protein
MSVHTTYCCDRCDYSQDTPDQMWNVQALVWAMNGNPPHLSYADKDRKLWCRRCCEEMGILPRPKPREGDPPFVPPSFEDLVREIAREEIEAATGAR